MVAYAASESSMAVEIHRISPFVVWQAKVDGEAEAGIIRLFCEGIMKNKVCATTS
jgi:hypothetical protein